MLRIAKLNYIVNTINQNREDRKRFWQEVSENVCMGHRSSRAQLSKVVVTPFKKEYQKKMLQVNIMQAWERN